MVDEPVDHRRRRHRILEDPVPLAEDQVAGDQHALALVPLGQEGEEHLHLVAALLHIPDVIEDDRVVAVQLPELLLQPQFALGPEQPLHQRVGRREEHPPPAAHQLMADRARHVGLATTGQTEEQHVLPALHEASFAQRREHLGHRGREPLAVERPERLLARQRRGALVALDAPATTLLQLQRQEVLEVLPEAPALVLGLEGDLLRVPTHRRQLEHPQHHRQRVLRAGRGGGAHVPTSPSSAS